MFEPRVALQQSAPFKYGDWVMAERGGPPIAVGATMAGNGVRNARMLVYIVGERPSTTLIRELAVSYSARNFLFFVSK